MGVVSSYLCHPEQAAKSVEPKPKRDLCHSRCFSGSLLADAETSSA